MVGVVIGTVDPVVVGGSAATGSRVAIAVVTGHGSTTTVAIPARDSETTGGSSEPLRQVPLIPVLLSKCQWPARPSAGWLLACTRGQPFRGSGVRVRDCAPEHVADDSRRRLMSPGAPTGARIVP